MDVFEGPYYRLNKLLLTSLGLWPYQKALHKRLIVGVITFLMSNIFWPEFWYVVTVWGDMDAVIEAVTDMGIVTATFSKFLTFVINAGKIKKLMDQIQEDWKGLTDSQLTIMERYANNGRKLTLLYTAAMLFVLVTYLIIPMVPKIFGLLMDRNQSWTPTPLPIKYGPLDSEKYYPLMMVHFFGTTVITMTTISAMDTMYFVYVLHACGILAAISYQLENVMETLALEESDDFSFEGQEEATYEKFRHCVKLHSRAIEFADALESIYVVVFFIIVVGSAIFISASGFKTIQSLGTPSEAFRFGCVTLALIGHLFFLSWPGQMLIDHSERIRESVYCSPWFQTSARSKRLLMIMMLRSDKPCTITAGKFYIMSFPSFTMVVKSAGSCFTMMNSFQ